MLALDSAVMLLEYFVDSMMLLMVHHLCFFSFFMKLIWARFCSSLDLAGKSIFGFMIAVIHYTFNGCQHHIFICIWFLYGFQFNQSSSFFLFADKLAALFYIVSFVYTRKWKIVKYHLQESPKFMMQIILLLSP